MSELLCTIIVLISSAVQLVILFLTANRLRFLRFAVPVLAVIAGVIFFLLSFTAPPGWGLILWPLVLLFVFLGLGLVLVGWALAWFVYYLINLIKRKASDTP